MRTDTMIYMAVALSALLPLGTMGVFLWSERRWRERERWLRDHCMPLIDEARSSSAQANEEPRLIPIQRRPFHEALWEDEPDLAPSPKARAIVQDLAARQRHDELTGSEIAQVTNSVNLTSGNSEMIKLNQAVAMTVLAAGALSACGKGNQAVAFEGDKAAIQGLPNVMRAVDPDATSPTDSVRETGFQKFDGATREYLDCKSEAQGAIRMADCIAEERDRQDERLNRIYKELIGLLDSDSRERMVEAQRTWLRLQEEDGAFEASIFDDMGQIGNLQAAEYEMLHLRERANQLEKYLELVRSK